MIAMTTMHTNTHTYVMVFGKTTDSSQQLEGGREGVWMEVEPILLFVCYMNAVVT